MELRSQVQAQMDTINSMMGQRSAIIKEELKTPFSFIVYGFTAVFCALQSSYFHRGDYHEKKKKNTEKKKIQY